MLQCLNRKERNKRASARKYITKVHYEFSAGKTIHIVSTGGDIVIELIMQMEAGKPANCIIMFSIQVLYPKFTLQMYLFCSGQGQNKLSCYLKLYIEKARIFLCSL